MVFGIVLAAAIAAYNFPLTAKTNCDYSLPGDPSNDPCFSCGREGPTNRSTPPLECNLIDIHGRNKNQPFKSVLKNVKLIASQPSENPVSGQLQITFRTSLRGTTKLSKFEILRAQPSTR